MTRPPRPLRPFRSETLSQSTINSYSLRLGALALPSPAAGRARPSYLHSHPCNLCNLWLKLLSLESMPLCLTLVARLWILRPHPSASRLTPSPRWSSPTLAAPLPSSSPLARSTQARPFAFAPPRPSSAGCESCTNFREIGALPTASNGSADITTLYVAKFGAPAPGSKVYVEAYQMSLGWTDQPVQFVGIVPASS